LSIAREVLRAIRALPCGDIADILQGGTPIVLAPHPDDEVIGCGALLAHAALTGVNPVVVFATDGSGSHPNSRAFPPDALAALRRREAITATGLLGIDPARVHFIGLRDAGTPGDGPPFNAAVDNVIRAIAPYTRPVIIAPWTHDPHRDHWVVSKMAKRMARMLSARHLSYLVWGWLLPDAHELGPIEIAGWRFRQPDATRRKRHAIQAYQSQISGLVNDDPTGFRLDERLLAAMLSEDEAFLLNP
jgi:LmbE family N-acetylglucosaminyl deacetylase